MVGLNHRFESGLQLDLSATIELVHVLKKGDHLCLKKLQILPDDVIHGNPQMMEFLQQSGGKILTVNDSTSGYHEIIVPKSIVKEVFLESYQYIYKSEMSGTCSDAQKITELNSAALGTLLMTPVDTTALDIYWNTLLRMGTDVRTLCENYFLLGSYLTCNYDKCNKSSCLWQLFKKLHCILLPLLNQNDVCETTHCSLKGMTVDSMVERGNVRLLDLSAIRICLDSITVHPRNYYASTALRFFIGTIGDIDTKKMAILLIIDHLSSESDDYSIWLSLADALIDCKFKIFDYQREDGARLGLRKIKDDNDISCIFLTDAYHRMKVIAMRSGSYGGLMALFRLNRIFMIDDVDLEMAQIIESFEKKHQTVIDIRRKDFLHGNISAKSDGLLKGEFERVYQMKRVLVMNERLRKFSKNPGVGSG